MKQYNTLKHIVYALLTTVCILLFYIAGGAAAQITKQDATGQCLVQGIAIWAGVITAVIYLKIKNKSLKGVGFCAPQSGHCKRVYYYLPIVIIEATGFMVGFRELSVEYCLAAFFMTLAVGFAEEIYFRALVFRGLRSIGTKKAILISSVFFGLGHLSNIIGGKDVFLTLLQVVFAFTFGVVVAELYLLSKSLYPCILIHFLHDFFSYIQSSDVTTTVAILMACHVTLMILYSVILWKRLFSNREGLNDLTKSA